MQKCNLKWDLDSCLKVKTILISILKILQVPFGNKLTHHEVENRSDALSFLKALPVVRSKQKYTLNVLYDVKVILELRARSHFCKIFTNFTEILEKGEL